MLNFPFLSALLLFPLVGGIFILLATKEDKNGAENARQTALWTTGLTFILALALWSQFDSSNPGFQFVEKRSWLPDYEIAYYLGIDGISLLFVLLTTFLMPICILASWNTVQHRAREYMAAFLFLEAFIIGVFVALDLLLFYVFFEAVLIPMYLIIGIWGGDRRIYASFKFFLYTLAGSLLFLVAILYIYLQFNTMDIPRLMEVAPTLEADVQRWLWLALFAAFAVKIPMWPVHTWLPDAHVQAPTAGSVILAGVLLKMGGYGFIRFSLPMLPEASAHFASLVFALSVLAVVVTSLIALVQHDMKKLIAYSSVAHMGFVTIGTFSMNIQGLEGAIMQMISHGLVSAALFLCVGVVYDRLHTREIVRYGGLVERMPLYAAIFMVFTMASVGLPGTSGFVGEFLVLLGSWDANPLVTAGAALGLILGAAYMLWLYRRVVFGPLVHADLKNISDLSVREKAIFAPLVLLVIVLGFYPEIIIKPMREPVKQLALRLEENQIQTAQHEISEKDQRAILAATKQKGDTP